MRQFLNTLVLTIISIIVLTLNSCAMSNKIKCFDPINKIFTEVEQRDIARGEFMSEGLGKDIVFTIEISTKTDLPSRETIEIFNPTHSITIESNDEEYNKTALDIDGKKYPFRPLLAQDIMYYSSKGVGDPDFLTERYAVFNKYNGNLNYYSVKNYSDWGGLPVDPNDPNGGCVAYIKCHQKSYQSFLKDLESVVLDVRAIKITVSDEIQFSNSLRIHRNTMFGSNVSDTLEPLAYMEPESENRLTVDIEKEFFIDKNTAIYMEVEANQKVLITFFVKAYKNNGINFN